ncbi:ABC transporter permease DevC [Fischerella thermalis]|jgi:putative ABC transport system permease protein|uniref:DevC protein n=1 Tax=Fischerella thermalis JSC-11 TaxID=741277 RepID=G6FYM0_9CYAN|nr:ABC transporter permease DevC [Fischerella thermalis]EHC09332.1 DevC protein [Fischerella thermalis JSC-11]PLZ07636.1 ABC transporter permease [Fischerella thermalis WC119]PLZ13001.1 ABC transporter permease [Fischerella thermalis WC1110]PLZ15657.1 ABC transporter permease [Fischerella thermalis WC114]PLZ17843.1 ABC transporter permease [Fischerella thermalis WC157]
MRNKIPVAWLQLARQKLRFLVALAGIAFVAVLMFMQIGFQDALYASATQVQKNLEGDLFLISSQYKSLTSNQSFPRIRLYQALGFDDIESVNSLYVQFAKLKNPINGRKFPIYVLGFDPAKSVFKLPEVNENLNLLKRPNVVLFDRGSRPEFGPIAEKFSQNEPVSIEIFGYNSLVGYRVKVAGLFKLGPSFGVDGNLMISYSTFIKVFQDRSPEYIDIGLLTLKPGADPQKVLAMLSAHLPEDVKVLTREGFIDFEKNYWSVRTPIGFIFNLMVIMGFIVGVVVVYQILYSNISSHLAEYATLKAMGFKNKYLLGVVFKQAFILAILGYIPGIFISIFLYDLAKNATKLPVIMSYDKALIILFATLLMCLTSAFLSTNKLRVVDPAEIF